MRRPPRLEELRIRQMAIRDQQAARLASLQTQRGLADAALQTARSAAEMLANEQVQVGIDEAEHLAKGTAAVADLQHCAEWSSSAELRLADLQRQVRDHQARQATARREEDDIRDQLRLTHRRIEATERRQAEWRLEECRADEVREEERLMESRAADFRASAGVGKGWGL